MSTSESGISRRRLLIMAGITAVAGTALTSCWGGGEEEATPTPSAKEPSYDEIKQMLREEAGTHHGTFAQSLMDAEVTNTDYLREMKVHADRFTCDGSPLAVSLQVESERDCGGMWANEILLSGLLTRASASKVAEFVRQQTGDPSIEDGIVAFGYNRFVDAAASREFGSPVFGHRTELTFLPGMDVWMPEEPPEGATAMPREVEDRLGNLVQPTAIYVLSGNGIKRVATDNGAEEQPLNGTRMELPRAMLNEAVGLDGTGNEQFTPVGAVERLGVDSLNPERFGWATGDVYYSRFDAGGQTTSSAPPASASAGQSPQVTDAPPVPPQQSNAFASGSISQTGQGLIGTPTTSTADPGPVLTWGPPELMPRNHIPWGVFYGFVGNASSQDACNGSVDTAQALSMTAVGGYLVGCGKIVIAASAGCLIFFWACGIAGMAICAATAAGLAVLANHAANQARRACRTPNLTYN